MINLVLLKKEIKSNYKILFIFMAILTLYSSMIVSMFDPKLGESLKMMSESMSGIFSAFNMSNPGTSLIEFICNYLYGFLFIAFPLVFIGILTNRLIVKYTDKGSLSYILSTPNSRFKIIFSWLFVMIFMLLILVIYISSLIIILSQVMFNGELDISKFLLVNCGVFGLWIFILGICFLTSCIFNDSRYALSVGIGINVLFLLIQMISGVGEKFSYLKYLTPLTLFDTAKIIEGDILGVLFAIILYVIGILLFCIGIKVFCKKDLSI